MAPHPIAAPLLLKSCNCPMLFQDTISLGHLPQHLICFWWPCRDVAIHMGNWVSLWPTPLKLLSFSLLFFYYFLSHCLCLAHKHTLTTCTFGRERLLWLSHPCVLIQEITQMIGHTNGPPVFSGNILISVSEIRQMTWRLIFITPLRPFWFICITFIAFLIGFPLVSCSLCRAALEYRISLVPGYHLNLSKCI